ncbi:MAG: hypothetical protein A3C35_03910 [Omnitrophica bacterium RIFCSPHIGHO2_02_FULL_46_11]|nr:MAG: hypothetical protein A3A81_07035 [Omnitrophica bacterium RIFCSPLOWO2_01_FULL_45_10b]OGW86012.1 MAG: hypothetical protein A3C35_03910 [Omnitrophica bacterium RIFCSPHIGHO2_02_FULL_46_11]
MDQGKVSVQALALAGSFLVALSFFIAGILNLIVPTYGLHFLWFASSVFPGYHAEPHLISVLTGTAYAAADGFIMGGLLALFYNLFCSIEKHR